jgi:hypothetical protein
MTTLTHAIVRNAPNEGLSEDALIRAALRSPLSLIEYVREQIILPAGGNLLIFVHQFEEMFRERNAADQEEAESFVDFILRCASEPSVPIYVVLTLRSDFLGRCADFLGLPEAVSDAQYHCPRLNREQIGEAIRHPAELFGGTVEPGLVNRLIEDMGAHPDQLPLMQHALRRLWNKAKGERPSRPVLQLGDYIAAGELKGGLSQQADQILYGLESAALGREEIARRMFCLLADGEGEAAVRRPVLVLDVMAVAECSIHEVMAVADPFRDPDCGFLTPSLSSSSHLDTHTMLDLGDESLIRHWKLLTQWLNDEGHMAKQYREYRIAAQHWATEGHPLLGASDIAGARIWRTRHRLNAAWAARYGGDFDLTMKFLDESEAEETRKNEGAHRQQAAKTPIFISHASKDRKIAAEICDALEDRGFVCWMANRDVKGGEDFADAIVRVIRTAKVMVLVFSENANNSDEVKKELALASQSRMILIPLRTEDILPEGTFAYQLATRQWIDFFDDWELSIRLLVRQLNNIMGIAPQSE